MVKIIGNAIEMTRGDSLVVSLALSKDGNPYIPSDGDVVRFAVSEKYAGNAEYRLMLSKVIPNDTMTLILTPRETSKFSYKVYNYDIQLTYADGTIDTFISSTLKFTGEVE